MAETAPSIEERISAVLNPEAPQDAQEVPQETPQEEQSGLLDEQGDWPQEQEETPQEAVEEDSDQQASDQQASGEESDEEFIEIDGDINKFAEQIGVDVADLYEHLSIPYTKDGERHEFTLSQIKDSLSDWQDTIAKRDQIQTELSQYQQSREQAQTLLQQQAEFLNTYVQRAHESLLKEMQGINWDQLHQQNPGEWARQSEMFRRKGAELQQMQAQAMQELQQKSQELHESQMKMQQDLLQREQRELLRAIPEWRDDKVADTERAALVEYMRDNGFKAEEINGITDHRALVLARKAMQFDRMKQSGDVAKKKVMKLQKRALKPGAKQNAAEAQRNRERQVVKNHRANPKSIDAAAARIQMRVR